MALLSEHAMQLLTRKPSPYHDMLTKETLYPLTAHDMQILKFTKSVLTGEHELSQAGKAYHLHMWMMFNHLVNCPRYIELQGKNLMLHPMTSKDVSLLKKLILEGYRVPEETVNWFIAWLQIVCMLTPE